ncbi:hypothetical protein BgiBS90_006816, partial [Biomphalaria glabrata]
KSQQLEEHCWDPTSRTDVLRGTHSDTPTSFWPRLPVARESRPATRLGQCQVNIEKQRRRPHWQELNIVHDQMTQRSHSAKSKHNTVKAGSNQSKNALLPGALFYILILYGCANILRCFTVPLENVDNGAGFTMQTTLPPNPLIGPSHFHKYIVARRCYKTSPALGIL